MNQVIQRKILDVGCGREKMPGAIGLDIIPLPGVDVVHDLNIFPYPFPDNEFDYIRMSHVIEHVENVIMVMEQIYRIAKPDGIVDIVTPHYTDDTSWRDVTHRWHFHSESFSYFDADLAKRNYITIARFETINSYVAIQHIGKILGLQYLINLQNKKFRSLRKFWEKHLSYLIRGVTISVKLKALKGA